jgi:polysaccharide deacetylase 2 family uncharacterized protein YibQ
MIHHISRRVAVTAMISLIVLSAHGEPTPRVAIIIDDLGYHVGAGRRAIDLPGPVVCAILPGTPGSALLAGMANEAGKEVLLHLPLQAVGHEGPPETDGITLDMGRERFAATFTSALDSVPFASGVNSHRGSLLTRHPGHMRWLMEDILEADGLYFVDSYTTHHSVAMQIAKEQGVPAIRRDVFLDAELGMLDVEFDRLKAIAREQGAAVAIGHPYPSTLAFLERAIPRLVEEGIQLVSLKDLIEYH